MAIALEEIADAAYLRRVWRQHLRKRLRRSKFESFNLCSDAVGYAAYDWGLEDFSSGLAREIKMGNYAPQRGEVLRSAKGLGLSRPLSFLVARDALVYKAITFAARSQLVSDAEKWVGFEHVDDEDEESSLVDDSTGESFDWFNFWLRRQGGLDDLVAKPEVNFLVESDVANYYPSIRLDAVREHLLSRTTLDKEVVRLCLQIIDGVMPRLDYSEISVMGLPQEQLDSSRPIAHSLLLHLDKAFQAEGESGRYTRYMDDILIGVEDRDEGERAVARLQRSLETLGLYPNAAKTRITSTHDYLTGYMVESLSDIDRMTEATKRPKKRGWPSRRYATPELRREIRTSSAAHRALNPTPRRWARVTRRFYTLHRATGMRDWWDYWRSDLDSDPAGASPIFEYVRSWPLDEEVVKQLVGVSQDYFDLYSDIPILAAETVLTAPVGNDSSLWSVIALLCAREFTRLARLSQGGTRLERLAAPWLLASWKYGDTHQRRSLLKGISTEFDAMSPVRAQAMPLLAADGVSLASKQVGVKPGSDWGTTLTYQYLRSIQEKDREAVKHASWQVRADLALLPQRYMLPLRLLPLLSILGYVDPELAARRSEKILRLVVKNPVRLRDKRVETLLRAYSGREIEEG